MTPTKRIAVALFGWKPIAPPPECNMQLSWYMREDILAGVNERNQVLGGTFPDRHWPDLTDWNWVRRMEDAMAEKGLGRKYVEALIGRYTFIDDTFDAIAAPLLGAPAAQRVAAAIAVLDHVEAEAKKQGGQG